ncbi:hypothetical protein TWF103_009637 [Orbilia oligospora]|nr:hypothetical protein TWF103_009637 [Orbilia oligospora]
MSVAPIWYTILQQENFKDIRYYNHIYPTIHRLTFEEDLEIDLHVVKGHIGTASIWKRPAPFKNKPQYLLANIDLKSEQPSVLSERIFRDDFSGFSKDKIGQIHVSLIEVILVAFTSNDPNARFSGPWKRRWLLSEQIDPSFEGMTILDLLQFTMDVVAASHNLAMENLHLNCNLPWVVSERVDPLIVTVEIIAYAVSFLKSRIRGPISHVSILEPKLVGKANMKLAPL